MYITDAVKIIAENTARIGGGSTMRRRWIETLRPNAAERAADNRPPEEIIADVAGKAGLVIKKQ